MTTREDRASAKTIGSYLNEPLTVGEPDVSGPLAVFPIFGAGATQHFVSFAQGREAGAVTIKEVGSASVRDLTVANAGDVPVLLYEGEEVLGGQQNRSFDDSLLVAGGTVLTVPVSCVEAGRWDHSSHGVAYCASPQSSYPEMRQAKHEEKERRRAAGMHAAPDQSQVWGLIDAKSARMRTSSPTHAMSDIYDQRRHELRRLTEAVQLCDGQLGMLVAVAGRFCVMDFAGRADVFASLHAPLVGGYALDALEALGRETEPARIESARGFVSLVCGAGMTEHDSAGLGRGLLLAEDGVAGSGLVNDGELVQLTAFPQAGGGSSGEAAGRHAASGSVRRPSQRHPRP
jgi:hypothetical protein